MRGNEERKREKIDLETDRRKTDTRKEGANALRGVKMRRLVLMGVLAGLFVLAACSGTPTGKAKPAKYTFNGLAELNLDDGKDYLYLEFTSDGKGVPGSFVRTGNDTLRFNSSGIINVSTPKVSWTSGGNVVITVQDTAASFSRTILAHMPGDLAITDFVPASHIYQSGNVVVDWNGSALATGYIVTCVQRQANGEAKGYAFSTGTTAATIGPETFQHRILQDQRIIDSFYVYVIVYNSTYYPRPGPKYLDTPEFGKLDFPVSALGADLAGSFGAAVVSRREALDVVAQQ